MHKSRFKSCCAIVLLMFCAVKVEGMLYLGPEIAEVKTDLANSNHIWLRFIGLELTNAISLDGGLTFQLEINEFPKGHWTTNLNHPPRHYVLVNEAHLFRSIDGGASWTNTSTGAFLRLQTNKEIERVQKVFEQEASDRLPQRSNLWHPLFATFATAYVLLLVYGFKSSSKLKLLTSALRGGSMFVLVWCSLVGFHAFVLWNARAQWPAAYWDTSRGFFPTAKTGLVMGIAANPIPLLIYLCCLWPLLPGASEVINKTMPSFIHRWPVVRCLFATLFLIFHLWIIFVGYWNG
ncbi:MAG: hypothetical protein ACO1QB_15940 [Verrucomicrobiales bacterium]